MKNLAKSTLAVFAALFVLGGIVAVASVWNCGTLCDFAATQAAELSDAVKKARAEHVAAEQVSQTQVQ